MTQIGKAVKQLHKEDNKVLKGKTNNNPTLQAPTNQLSAAKGEHHGKAGHAHKPKAPGGGVRTQA